jgi:hypothetical protein
MGNGCLLHLASLVQLKSIKVRADADVPSCCRESCEQSPSLTITARPETPGIEAQTTDTQGTRFSSSETSKDAENACQEQRRPRVHARHTGKSLSETRFPVSCAIKCLSLSEFSSSLVQDAMKVSDIALSQKVIAKNFIGNRRFATDRKHLGLQRNVQIC